ncbi:hypothetical protein LPTSP4_32770 [Leptospira ryugenii]|uniref:Tetratricopeptide repeat protein n=1 Tax=Leptospira ryugenii TaxID=1917863 RepID=A0A2P2E4C7_9LEPT|nr:hypothetical protein [Leptospira ryugenii]GBF51739.1 hypothetical protein LPTSP4_32770 [Leptospira ryugenii]
MAEPNDNFSPEEVAQIEGLLSALNKNPQSSEELNPMAKVLREKLGYAEPIQVPEEGVEYAEDGDSDAFSDQAGDDDPFAGLEAEDSGPPPFRNLEAEDDDIDLDELLGEDSPKPKTSPRQAEEEDSFDSPPVSEDPDLADFGLPDEPSSDPNLAQTPSDDPFADLGAPTPSGEESSDSDPFADFSSEPPAASEDSDPFSDFDSPAPVPSDDPFADSGLGASADAGDPFAGLGEDVEPSEPSPSFGDDPFASLGEATSGSGSTSGDDPFADFGAEPTETLGQDPFADLDSPPSSGGETDPFGDMGAPSADPFGDDPFASMEAPEVTPSTSSAFDSESSFDDLSSGFDEPSAPSSSSSDEGGFEDPFGDLGVGMEPPSLDDDLGSGGGFDDLAPSLDDIPVSSMETADDFNVSSGGIEDDLDSLGKEDEPTEDLDASLSDEDLAIIQRELVKYPPKLRRTITDTIVNNRVPVKNQKEIIELIKAQQKPEDVAQYLSSLLGERVELTDTSGRFAADGVPIIASKDAYTKEGAARRRELIRKTFFTAAAAIFLVVSLVSLYRFVYIPRMAGAQYELGLEQLEEYRKETDVQAKKKLLADAESYFNKGEDIEPFSLKYLNKYCDAYTKIGQYDKAFEKCFGKVEPDFGLEPADTQHVRSWSKRKEVPNISLANKSEWNDAGVSHAGKLPLPGLGFSLVSQDKVPRKVIKAGAYIASRLKYNIHDPDTYLALGRFHSFNRKDFIEIPPGSTQKDYKNDILAIEYFKRVFTDAGKPDSIEATAGIAKIYYNKREFGTAVKYYNDIIEKFPKDPIGHGGILSTYIEIWKAEKNPQYVLNHHRQVRNALDIESDLSLAVLAKLASFYIALDSEDVRIRYNINPEDQVSGMEIDDNVEYLLNIAYGKDYGNKFAEGYYQRAMYYFKIKEASRALKQLELAATYDNRHYLAVLAMAEYYLKVQNYEQASALLKEAESRLDAHRHEFGEREEDETLLEGKPGRIDYNFGKIAYLESAGINKSDNLRDFPGKKIYPERSLGKLSVEEAERRKGLLIAKEKFESALSPDKGLQKDEQLLREVHFFLGWIEYNQNEFAQALDHWSQLPEEDIYNNPTVLLGKGNSFYYTRQYNAALGNYLKLTDDYEAKEKAIGRLEPENSEHQEIYQTLTALYNNIGAVYEKKQDTINALKYYWKSMETARRIGIVSEIATSNKDLVFARARLEREPLLEDWLPPTLDRLKDLQ